MKHRNSKILFFSMSDARVDSFFQTIEDNKLTYNENALFSLEEKKKCFSHGADLLMFLDNYKDNIQSLHVILDIESISEKINSGNENDQDKQEQIVLQTDYIRKAILSYPEVQFLFDIRANGQNIISMLFPDENEVLPKEDQDTEIKAKWAESKEKIITELISIKWEICDGDEEAEDLSPAFYWAISGKDNTFDASNLRYALKVWKYISLKVYNHRNFAKLQDSRKDYLAICVEEEAKQNLFNSYALFSNGFRVLPVSSAFELNRTNKLVNSRNFDKEKTIIVRDYDLQFEDEGKNVNKIRGYKYVANNPDDGYVLGWNDLRKHDTNEEDVNIYWSNLSGYPEYYITKGPKHTRMKKARRGKQSRINKSKKILYLRGILKPVSGLYVSLHSIAAVRDRYKATRYSIRDKGYEIITSRKNHDHSSPLDIYELINNMLRRSENYYSNGRYRLAALVSEEALEIMNGFHLRLMIKASYINAKAENAISMDIVGGDEDILGEDASFRINKIQEDIHRLHFNKGQLHFGKSTNVLNQIFSDCRIFCKDKEHFQAEDRFLSAMGHLNEGDFLPRFIRYCWDLILFKKHHKNED